MNIAAMTFRLRASWVHSLKEKRMIVKSLTAQLQNRFHVSSAEIGEQENIKALLAMSFSMTASKIRRKMTK